MRQQTNVGYVTGGIHIMRAELTTKLN